MKVIIKVKLIKLFLWFASMGPFHVEAQSKNRSTVLNQRDEMALAIENGELEKIFNLISIYDIPSKESIDYNVLMVWEQELMQLINGEYTPLLDSITKNERFYYHSRNIRTYLIGFRFKQPPYKYAETQIGDKLNRALLNYLELNRTKIELDITNANLNQEEKDFLYFYLNLNIFYNGQCEDRNQELKGDSANNFIRKHFNSDYARIVRKYGRFNSYQSDWKTEYNLTPLGFGVAFNRSNNSHLGKIFNFLHVGVALSYKNIFAQASGGLSGLIITQPNIIYKNYELGPNSGFTGDITIGYNFHLDNYNYTISPFIGIMGSNLKSSIMEPGYIAEEHEYEDYKVGTLNLNNRAPFIGINFDVNTFIRSKCYGEQLRSRNFQRLQIGISSKRFPIASNLSEANYIFFRWSFGINNETERRTFNF